MMYGHGANPIFCTKKIKIGRLKHSLTPHPLRPITSHFYLTLPPLPLEVDVICVSPLYVQKEKISTLKIFMSSLFQGKNHEIWFYVKKKQYFFILRKKGILRP